MLTGSDEEVQKLNTHLWIYQDDSWLPHGSKKDGKEEEQPIWLCSEQENPNNANILALVGGAEATVITSYSIHYTKLYDQRIYVLIIHH